MGWKKLLETNYGHRYRYNENILGFDDVRVGNENIDMNSPPGRKDHTFVYCPFDSKVYLYGGWNPFKWGFTDAYFDDIWSLDSGIRFVNYRLVVDHGGD